jgi:hypothetical protein
MTKTRDLKLEALESNKKLAIALEQLRQLRNTGELTNEMIRVAQALVLCGLPYQPTDKTKLIRKVRLGDGSTLTVIFTAALEGQMPYGSDRTLLYWMVDKAIKYQSPFVSWKRATEFLKELGMAESGKNRKDLKERFKRLSGLTIGITRRNGDDSLLFPLIEEKHLPSSVDVKEDQEGHQLLPLAADQDPHAEPKEIVFGFKLNERLFKDLLSHNIPIPLKLLQKTQRKSQMQDLLIFLYWRSYAAQSETIIPWTALQSQLAHDDSNPRRIKIRFRQAISMLRTIWPEFAGEVRKAGLWIAPPLKGSHFLADLPVKRRLPTPETPNDIKQTIERSFSKT